MKTLKIFITFLFFSVVINAQNDNLLFEENFDNNNNDWGIKNSDDSQTEIKNGCFYMHNKTASSYYTYWNSFDFETNKDFVIEEKIMLYEGDPDDYAGIIFCAKGVNDKYSFSVSANGYYRTAITQDGELIGDWNKTSFVKPIGQYNILKVQKKGLRLYYYVNDSLVGVKKFTSTYGKNYGFILSSSAKAKADYLKIYGTRPQINIVSNPIMNPKDNLGSAINSKYDELHPVISPDGQTLYFVRDDHPKNIGDSHKNDIWYSNLNGDTWSKAVNIGRPINNSGHNAIIAVTPDNNTLILKARYTAFGEELGAGFSYTTRNNDGTWAIPKNFEIDNYYNDGEYSSFSLSTDLQVLICDIERSDDTKGENDLYVSFRKSDGSYTEPKNLGSVINTKADEGTPFLAADGKTLYFASSGHSGYGSSDIFVSKRLDNTWTNWSEPLNLGPNINSSNWDAYFTLDASGEYAYLVSSVSGYGEEDIFRVKLQDELKPEPVVLIYGKVLDKETDKPLDASILYDDFVSGDEVGVAKSNSNSGDYKIILPCGKKYGFFAKKNGYFAVSDNIDLTDIKEYTEIERDLYLVPIKTNDKIVLNNIFFKSGKSELLASSYPELNRLVKMMEDNSKLQIEIQGYTNNIGNRQELINLSLQRSEEVKKYLVQKGISPSRVTTKGFGPDSPIADNNTAAGRAKNQRVEFLITNQ